MKATLIPIFPRNVHLQHILQQLVKEFLITAIFYDKGDATDGQPQLFICVENPKDAGTIRERKWFRNALAIHKVVVGVQSRTALEDASKRGNPFVIWLCHPTHLIYGNVEAESGANIKKLKKKFQTYQERFCHDQDLLISQANKCDAHESVMGSFINYISVFEHDIEYLENLYIGSNSMQNLHQRIQLLIPYLPALEKLFVKKKGNEYYIIHALEKAKTVGDQCCLNAELYPCIRATEQQLYKMITRRFAVLKKMNQKVSRIPLIPILQESILLDEMLSEAMTSVIEMAKPEEIYHYYTKTSENQTSYYLLLVGEGLGTKVMERIQQCVLNKTETKCSLVLVGHCRIWIQDNIYLHQEFFKKIMTEDQKIYTSNPYLPPIHFEEPYEPYYPDLTWYYEAAKGLTEQYFNLRMHHIEDNFEGYYSLFATAFTRILRIFIFRSICYKPNYLAPEILWKLCIYAKPELQKLEFLFEKLAKERFFLLVTHYLKFNDFMTPSSEEKLLMMDEILLFLMEELKLLLKE